MYERVEKNRVWEQVCIRVCLRSLHYTSAVPKIQPFWKLLGKQAEVQRRSCSEPRVNFLLGFLIKSCGELYYLQVCLEWVKGAGYILTGVVDSEETVSEETGHSQHQILRTVFVHIVLRMTERNLNTQTFYFVQCLALFTWVMSCNLQVNKFLCMACVKTHEI